MVTSSIGSNWSLMAPVRASFKATVSSSNLGQRIPGVSRISRSLLVLSHCCPLVTPGLLPTTAIFFPAKRFMSVDLPAFGIPIIMVRKVSILIPRSFWRAILSAMSFLAASVTTFTVTCSLELIARVWIPCDSKY